MWIYSAGLLVFILQFRPYESIDCYQCPNIENLNDCHNAVTCAPGQVCFTDVIYSQFKLVHSLGCRQADSCLPHVQSLFGRRFVQGDTPLCSDCCSKDVCNKHICDHVSTPCVDSPSVDCQSIKGFICGDVQTATKVCPKTCGLCSVVAPTHPPTASVVRKFQDCRDILDIERQDGSYSNAEIHTLHILNKDVTVICDMTTRGGGWTTIMNRWRNSVSFDRNFQDYVDGFGSVLSDYWIGLEAIHELTSDGRQYELLVHLTDGQGHTYEETYNHFSVGPGTEYILHVGSFNGSAGDSLSGHNGQAFTTTDNDRDGSLGNCARVNLGGWWFHNCQDSCLTCQMIPAGTVDCTSMSWNSVKQCTALKSAKMMIRPM